MVTKTNGWTQWANDLGESFQMVNQIQQLTNNFGNGMSYTQMQTDLQQLTQIDSGSNPAYSDLYQSPAFAAFSQQLFQAINATASNFDVSIPVPNPNIILGVSNYSNFNPNGTLNFAFNVTFNTNSGEYLDWPSGTSWGFPSSTTPFPGVSTTYGQLLAANIIQGQSFSFEINGVSYTCKPVSESDGNISVQISVSGPASNFIPSAYMTPNCNNPMAPLQNFLNNL